MKIKLNLLSIIVCLMLGACLKVEPKGTGDKVSPEISKDNERFAQANISYNVRGLDKPQHYEVEFRGVKGLFVQKKRNGVATTDRSVEDTYIDSNVVGGETISYLIYDELSGQQHILQSIDLDIPKDLVFEKKLVLSEPILKSLGLKVIGSGPSRQIIGHQFKRIFFENDAILITNGESLQFIAEEIYFRRAVIQTFENGSTAPLGKEGRSGGVLDFQAKVISGDVFVELRGENGGQGFPGPAPDEKLKGADGFPGVSPIAVTLSNCPANHTFCGECRMVGTTGTPGNRGDQGYPGGAGLRGGSSGELRWKADSAKDLNWQIQKFPGHGGIGGSGGLGGLGGKGGVTPAVAFCPSVPDAKDGAPGPLGVPGDYGNQGELQPACLFTNEDKYCR
jgi:hypothetical protein